MYKKLYREIIDKPVSENRTKNQGVYYEKHHIIPDFMFINRKRKGPRGHLPGNPNDPTNIVYLTFREHLMAHYYLYEINKGTRYEYATGSALQFFFVKATGGHMRQKKLELVDEEFLIEMDHLRKIGVSSISNARKGTMPVKDKDTGEILGSVSVDHPNVLSGQWVHHSKGVPSKVKPENRRNQKGMNNANARPDITVDTIVNFTADFMVANELIGKRIAAKSLHDSMNNSLGISGRVLENRGIKNTTALIGLVNNMLHQRGLDSVIYDPYFRGEDQRKQLAKIAGSYCWATDGVVNTQMKKTELDQYLLENPKFRRGKSK